MLTFCTVANEIGMLSCCSKILSPRRKLSCKPGPLDFQLNDHFEPKQNIMMDLARYFTA